MAAASCSISAEGRVRTMAEHDGCKGCAYVSRGEHDRCLENIKEWLEREAEE